MAVFSINEVLKSWYVFKNLVIGESTSYHVLEYCFTALFKHSSCSRNGPEPRLVKDLHSVTSLADMMTRLCSNHQRHIVNAFTFLAEEIKAHKKSEPVDTRVLPVTEMAPVSQTESCSKTVGVPVVAQALNTGNECENAKQKRLTVVVVKNRNCINLKSKSAEVVPDKVPDKVTLEPVEQTKTPQTSSTYDPKTCPNNADAIFPDIAPPCLPKTARKSLKVLRCRSRDVPLAERIPHDPDNVYDIVYVAKPITACELVSPNHVVPRKNARKSTRGHRYVGECWEVQTVRTQSRRNCPVTTSVTPRQVLAKPDGVPATNAPHTGDCVEATASENMSGDAGDVTDEQLMVEPSQTGQHQDSSSPKITNLPIDVESAMLSAAEGENSITSQSSKRDSNPELRRQSEHVESIDSRLSKMSDGSGGLLDDAVKSCESYERTCQVLEACTKDKSEEPSYLKSISPKDDQTPKQTEDLGTAHANLVKDTEQACQGINPPLTKSEQMSLRNGNATSEERLVGSLSTGESIATRPVEKPERMPLRSRNSAGTFVKTQERMPLRSGNSYALEQSAFEEPQAPHRPERMPLRNRNSVESLTANSVEKPELLPLSSRTSTALGNSVTSGKQELLPLRSTSADHPGVPPICSTVYASPPERLEQTLLKCTSVELQNLEEPCQSPFVSSPEKLEQTSLSRKGTNVDQPSVFQPCSTVSADPAEQLEQMCLSSNSTAIDQCSPFTLSSPEKPERMPLSSRSSTTVEQSNPRELCQSYAVDSPEKVVQMSLRSRTGTILDQSSNSNKPERMPLRSRTSGNPPSDCEPCSFVSTSSLGRQDQMLSENNSGTNVQQYNLKEPCQSPSVGLPERPNRMPLRSSTCTDVDCPKLPQSCSSVSVRPTEWPEQMPIRSKNITAPNINSSTAEIHIEKSESRTGSTPEDSSWPSVGCLSERKELMSLRSRSSIASDQRSISRCHIATSDSKNMRLVESPRTPLRIRYSQASTQMKPLDIVASSTSQGEDSDPTRIKMESMKHMPLRSDSICKTSDSPFRAIPESPGPMSLRSGSSFEMPACSETPWRCKKTQSHQRSSKKSLLHFFQEAGSSSFQGSKSKAHTPALFTLFDLPPNKPESSQCKFLEALSREASQRSLLDLNSKFEKMHKGWVHTDKESQPVAKHKNKADRLKEIWKSKRRTKKPRSLERHRVSPVQMLFMRSFDLPSICRWFLQTTETKSLVIVKKVNTRLPSETNLGFPSFSSASESQGIFPSLQAERLKKHLKKFAIMCPVRSNPKNKRLIAKALAKGAKEPPGIPLKSRGPRDTKRNPASVRILRKYSNMRLKTERTSKDPELLKKAKPVTLQDTMKEATPPRKRKFYPPASEDQVLTRSQGRLDIELSPTGVMKPPKKLEIAPAKRSRTSK